MLGWMRESSSKSRLFSQYGEGVIVVPLPQLTLWHAMRWAAHENVRRGLPLSVAQARARELTGIRCISSSLRDARASWPCACNARDSPRVCPGFSRIERRSMSDTDGRRSPRIEVDDRVAVSLTSPGHPLHLVDVSWGGFLVASADALPEHAMQFTFSTPDGRWRTKLAATPIHRHIRSTPDQASVEHVAGFKFLDLDRDDVMDAIDQLLDHAIGLIQCSWTDGLDDDRASDSVG